tara:strand:+ start:211 stop:822 length:612 start_codon:yes stop_codon:yes gene_type:complete
MNRKEYNGDTRYAKVLEQMDLLGIMDVSTTRQSKNGTIVWKLPIKNKWNDGSLIEVGSFSTGYVRNNNSGYSNYQLNKRCENEPEYFPVYKWVYDENGQPDHQIKTDKYRKWTTRGCKLIPIEIDRLEYLISYCLKNYYIKHANFVASGEYVPKWKHEWELKRVKEERDRLVGEASQYDCGHYERIRDLENKLDTIQRISEHE